MPRSPKQQAAPIDMKTPAHVPGKFDDGWPVTMYQLAMFTDNTSADLIYVSRAEFLKLKRHLTTLRKQAA